MEVPLQVVGPLPTRALTKMKVHIYLYQTKVIRQIFTGMTYTYYTNSTSMHTTIHQSLGQSSHKTVGRVLHIVLHLEGDLCVRGEVEVPLQVVGLLIEGDRTMGDLWPLQVGFNQGHLWASGYEKGKFSTLCYIIPVCILIQTW